MPFLALAPNVRNIFHTANAIESLNYQLRKIVSTAGHFPNEDAVVKLLWRAIRDIEDNRAGADAPRRRALHGTPAPPPSKLVEAAVTQGWKPALAARLIAFPDRLAVRAQLDLIAGMPVRQVPAAEAMLREAAEDRPPSPRGPSRTGKGALVVRPAGAAEQPSSGARTLSASSSKCGASTRH